MLKANHNLSKPWISVLCASKWSCENIHSKENP